MRTQFLTFSLVKDEDHLSNIYKFCSYLQENTLHIMTHGKMSLLWEPNRTYKYIVCKR